MFPVEISAVRWSRMYVNRVLMLGLMNPDLLLLTQRITGSTMHTGFLYAAGIIISFLILPFMGCG